MRRDRLPARSHGDGPRRADPSAGLWRRRAEASRGATQPGSCAGRALQSPFERLAQLGQRAAVAGIGRERVVEGTGELAWEVAAQPRQGLELCPDAPDRRCGRGTTNGVDSAERLVQHERERVEVGLHADVASLALLGSHVGERAEHVARARQRVLPDEARTAEVGQLRRRSTTVRTRGNQHVLGLDVAVDDATGVCVRERVG